MVAIRGTTTSAHYSVTARPNCSLTIAGTLCVFSVITIISLMLSIGLALIGAWPVLFFSGLELLTLGYCFYHVLLHMGDFEQLTIDNDKVVIEIHERGLSDKHFELSGYWTRLVLDCMPDGYCRWLGLRSKGCEIEFGRHMTSEERLKLARQLKPRLGGFMT